MRGQKRREFLKTCAAASGTALLPVIPACAKSGSSPEPADIPFTLGMASYTFRNFDVETAYAMTRRLGLEKIALKDFHLPMDSTPETIRQTAEKAVNAGLDLYGCGVVYMKTTDEVERAFEYARIAGLRVIIGVPEYNLLDLVNEKVQAHDIRLAIHNHGPGDNLYASPKTAYEKIRNMNPRMGLCIDVGHTIRNGEDPARAIMEFADRLHDVHIKDVSAAAPEGGTVEIGRGVIDIPAVLKALIKIGYSHTVSFEFEKDGPDPLPGVAESAGYVRGVLAMM